MNTESVKTKLNNILDKLDLQGAEIVRIIYEDEELNNDGVIILYEKETLLVIETKDSKTIELDLSDEELKTDIVNIIILEKEISSSELEKKKEQIEVKSKDSEESLSLSNKLTFDDSDILISTIKFIRESKPYEIIYSYNQQHNSLLEHLFDTNIYKKMGQDELLFKLENKATIFLDSSLENYNSNKKPLIENFINNNYNDFILKPLVYDIKKIYTKNQSFIDDDFDNQTLYPDIYFVNPDDELSAMIENIKNYHNKTDITKLQYDINNNEVLILEDEDKKRSFFYSINKPYLEEKPDINQYTTTKQEDLDSISNMNPTIKKKISYYQTTNVEFDQVIYRSCLKFPQSKRCNSLDMSKKDTDHSINKNNFIDSRIAIGNITVLNDNYNSNRLITEKKTSKLAGITTCTGSGDTNELFYSGAKDKKEHKISEYNKSLTIPPSRILYLKGESLKITGILLKSVHDFYPEFLNNTFYEKNDLDMEKYGVSNIIKFNQIKNIGYNLVDQINFTVNNTNNNTNILKNYSVYENINNVTNLDYTKNNFIYFNNDEEKINQITLLNYLDKVVPSSDEIFNYIEKDKLNKCNNFTEINSILQKYNLSIDNFSYNQIKKLNIHKLFENNSEYYIQYSKYCNLDKKQKKNVNIIAKQLIISILKNKKKIEKENLNEILIINNPSLYISNLIDKIFASILPIIKNNYTKDDLYDIVNFLNLQIKIDIQSDINDFNSILKNVIIKFLVTRNLYEYTYYKNQLYNTIFSQSDKLPSLNIEKLNQILSVYNIINLDSLYKYNLNYNNDLSNIELMSINFISNINKSFDNGNLFYDFISNVNKNEVLFKIKNHLNLIAKNYYQSKNNIPNSLLNKLWYELEESEKKKYYITEDNIINLENELSQIKSDYLAQKELYSFYFNKCDNFEIVKVYKDKNLILKYNKSNEDIYYDDLFDTTISDIKTAKELLDKNLEYNLQDTKFKQIMFDIFKEKYIFNSDKEINAKIENLIDNYDNIVTKQKRKIKQDNFALLWTNTDRVIYKYINRIWYPLNKEELMKEKIKNNSHISYLKKDISNNILNFTFEDLIVSNINIFEEEKISTEKTNTLEYNESLCISLDDDIITSFDKDIKQNSYNKICVPKKIITMIYKASKLNHDISDFNNITKSIKKLQHDILKTDNKITYTINNRNNISQSNKRSKIVSENKEINLDINKVSDRLWNIWKKAYNIYDVDIRLSEIKDIIANYGTIKKNTENSNDIDENFFYWDVPFTNEKMCCIHYDDLTEIAYKPDKIREEILNNIKIKYCTGNSSDQKSKGGIINNRFICNFCGETIDYIQLSELEGFTGEKPIQFRQKNLEENDDFTILYTDELEEIANTLDLYCSQIGIKLSNNDRDLIIVNSEITIKQYDLTISQYLNGDNTPYLDENINYPKNHSDFELKEGNHLINSASQSNLEKKQESYASYLKIFKNLDEVTYYQNINQIKEWKNELDNLPRSEKKQYTKDNSDKFNCILFMTFFEKQFLPNYYSYKSSINISIILQYLLNIIFYRIPRYIVTGSGNEKIAKIKFFNIDPMKPDQATDYLLKDITNKFISKSTKKIYNNLIRWETLNTIYGDWNKNEINYKIFKSKSWNFIKSNIDKIQWIVTLKDEYDIYHLNQLENIDNIIENEKTWYEFKPSLNVNYEYKSDIPDLINEQIIMYNENIQELIRINNIVKIHTTQQNIDEHQKLILQINTTLELIKKNILDQSRKLAEQFISIINRKIHEEFPESVSNSSLISYTYHCCSNNIKNNYLQFFEDDSVIEANLIHIINELNLANNFIDNINISENNNFIFNENNVNSNGNCYRKLLDYLNIDIDTKIYETDMFSIPNKITNYSKYLSKQLENLNLVNITQLFTENPNLIGKKRIWHIYEENDLYLLNEIYEYYAKNDLDKPTDMELNNKLVEKLKIKYSEFDEEYIELKAEVIMNTVNDKNVGVVKLDKVSGLYDFQIKKRIHERFNDIPLEELKSYILDFTKKTNEKNILNKNLTPIINYTTFDNLYKNELDIITEIQQHVTNIFNLNLKKYDDINHCDRNYNEYLKDILNDIKIETEFIIDSNQYDKINKKLIFLNAEFFGFDKLNKYIYDNRLLRTQDFDINNEISKIISDSAHNISTLDPSVKKKYNLSLDQTQIKNYLMNLGNQDNIFDETLKFIENRLIIENYNNEHEKKIEMTFRHLELKNKHYAKQIKTYNNYSKLIINLLQIFYYQINYIYLNKIIGTKVIIKKNKDGTSLMSSTKILYGKITKLYNNEINYDLILDNGDEFIEIDETYFDIIENTSEIPKNYYELYNQSIKNLNSKSIKEIRKIIDNKPWWQKTYYEHITKQNKCPVSSSIMKGKDYKNTEEKTIDEVEELYFDNYYKIIDEALKNIANIDKNNLLLFFNKIQYYINNSSSIFKLLDLLTSKGYITNINNNLTFIPLLGNTETLNISKYIFYRLLIFIFMELDDKSTTRSSINIETIIKTSMCDIIFNKNIIPNEKTLNLSEKEIKEILDIEKSKKNNQRLKNFQNMAPELQQVQQLMRKHNLGNQFGAFDDPKNGDNISDENREILENLISINNEDPDSPTDDHLEPDPESTESIQNELFGKIDAQEHIGFSMQINHDIGDQEDNPDQFDD